MEFWENFLSKKKVLLFLALIGFLIYADVISGSLMFDDHNFIEYNNYIHSLKNIFKFFHTSLESGSAQFFMINLKNNFYRPLQQVVHAVIYHFWGIKPYAYHIFSITLHIINSFFVYLFIRKFNFSKIAGLIGAILFLVHPVQVEAVSFVSGLCDPMALFFMMSAMLLFMDSYVPKNINRSLIKMLCSITLFLLALLSKESAVVFPVLVALVTFFNWKKYDSKEEKTFRLCGIAVLGVFTLIYVYLRTTVLTYGTIGLVSGPTNPYTQFLHVRLITFISILPEYLKLIFFPINLFYEKSYIWFENFNSIQGFLGFFILVNVIYAIYESFYGKKIVMFGLLWFFICLLPYMGFIPLNAIYLEHWLYFGMVATAIILASIYDGFDKLQYKKIMIYVLLPVFMLFSARVIIRNIDWADEIKFYKNEVKNNPLSQRSYSNMGLELFKAKRYYEALNSYENAIRINDYDPAPHNNIGVMFMEMRMSDFAKKEFYKALALDPSFIYSLNGLSIIYTNTKQPNKAKEFIQLRKNVLSGQRLTSEDIYKAKNIKN